MKLRRIAVAMIGCYFMMHAPVWAESPNQAADGKTIAVPNSGGVSPDLSELEGVYARSWIKNILHEMSS